MTKVNKDAKIQRAIAEENKAAIEQKNPSGIEDGEESSSYSSMFVNILNSDQEYSDVTSHRSPTLILQEAQLPEHLEEVHSSPVMEKCLKGIQ